MKSLVQVIGLWGIYLIVGVIAAAIAHRLGAGDFMCGGACMIFGRAAYDACSDALIKP